MKKHAAFGLALALILPMVGCGRSVQAGDVAGKTYVYEKDGFGGEFTVTINEDGSFQYYEGFLSSYIGAGTWQLEGDILSLSDDEEMGYEFVNHFQVDDGVLVFQEEDSSNFLYVKLSDGERFLEADGRT